jgi:hypothetical protein
MSEEIPDLNLFMMCEKLNEKAISELPNGYHIRNCRKTELDIWKAMLRILTKVNGNSDDDERCHFSQIARMFI